MNNGLNLASGHVMQSDLQVKTPADEIERLIRKERLCGVG